MKFSSASAAAILAFAGQVAAQANYTVTCYDGLAVLVNRASGEKEGFGVMSVLKDQILAQVPSSGAWYNPYPATIASYPISEGAGVGNLTNVLKAYVDKCPCHKVALLGFSQGAQVISDTLIGPSYPVFTGFGFNSGIGKKYTDAIAAAVMFADPAQIANITIDVGNSTKNGIFQRNNTANWETSNLVGRVQAYCQAEDYYCASGSSNNSAIIHRNAVNTFGAQGVEYIVQSWKNGPKNVCTASSNATNTTTTTGGTASSTGAATTTKATVAANPTNGAMKTSLSGALVLAALAAVL